LYAVPLNHCSQAMIVSFPAILLRKVGPFLLQKGVSGRGSYLLVRLSLHHLLFLFCRQFGHVLYGTERHTFGHTMMYTGGLLSLHHPGHAEVAEISSDLEG